MFAIPLDGQKDEQKESHSRNKRFLIEPPGTQMGIFGTISIPLEYEKQVSVAYFFEENWYTLANASWLRPAFESDIIEARKSKRDMEESLSFKSFSRKYAYIIIEKNIQNQGLPGRACLLRAICEHAADPLHHNGIIGDILYIIFTPSSSIDEQLPESFYQAEEQGHLGNCKKYIRACPTSIINSISFIMDDL